MAQAFQVLVLGAACWVLRAGCCVLGAACWVLRLATQHSAPGTRHPAPSTSIWIVMPFVLEGLVYTLVGGAMGIVIATILVTAALAKRASRVVEIRDGVVTSDHKA